MSWFAALKLALRYGPTIISVLSALAPLVAEIRRNAGSQRKTKELAMEGMERALKKAEGPNPRFPSTYDPMRGRE